MRMLVKWFVCFAALLIASSLFPEHFWVFGGVLALAGAATVLWLSNLAIRPILQIIALPVTILTFGIFSIIVNAGMVSLTDLLIPSIQIRGFSVCLLITVMISIGNWLFAVNLRRKS